MKNWHIFLSLITLYILSAFISNEYILTSDIYQKSFSNELTIDQIHKMITFKESYGWVAYLFNVLVLTIKLNFAAFCLFIGLFFTGKKIAYKKILKVVLLAEFVFVLYAGLRLFLIFINEFNTLQEIQHFIPLSLYSIFYGNGIPEWLIYPLSIMNVAELVYWFLLALGLTLILKTHYLKNLKTVLTSYGTGLLLWVVVLVFIQVYFLNPTI